MMGEMLLERCPARPSLRTVMEPCVKAFRVSYDMPLELSVLT
jgi:hypothetical protein